MIEYEYLCEDCEHNFCVFQSIKDKKLEICPSCNGDINRVIHITPAFVRQEAKTFGQLADRNTKKMGRYELESRREADRLNRIRAKNELRRQAAAKAGTDPILIKEDAPKVDLSLARMTKQQQQDYIFGK